MGVVWGASFLFMKVALEGVSFGQVAWSRTVLGALALGAIVLITRPRVPRVDGTPGPVLPRERVVWLHFLVVSLTTCVIPYLCFAWAEQYVSSSLASIYNATTPIMTALMATLVFRVERLGLSRWAGVGVGILGVIVVIGPWQYSALTGSLAGQLACLVATACYGFTFGYQRRFLSQRPIAPATFAFLSIGVSAVVMLGAHPVDRPHAGRPRLDHRRLAARARRARHGPRLHLEHQRAARLGSDRHLDGHVRDARRRRRAGRAAARRAVQLA